MERRNLKTSGPQARAPRIHVALEKVNFAKDLTTRGHDVENLTIAPLYAE